MLSGQFAPYDAPVSRAIEEAFQRGDDEIIATIRGSQYVIALKPPSAMKQQLVSDPSRQRAVRRVPAPATAEPAVSKRKRDADEADPVSDPVQLMDGLSYTCTFHDSASSKQYHGGSDVSIEFTCSVPGMNGTSCYDWRSTKGFLLIGRDSMPPLLTLKISDSINHLGGHSFSGGSSGHVYRTSFAKCPGASIDPSSTMLIKLDEQGLADAERVRRTALQHRPAFVALLDACGGGFNVELTSTHATNKATYITLKAETPRGSTFDLDVRIGGAHMSQSRVTRKLTADLVGSLREFAALGDGAGTYGRITLTATGSDLEVGHIPRQGRKAPSAAVRRALLRRGKAAQDCERAKRAEAVRRRSQLSHGTGPARPRPVAAGGGRARRMQRGGRTPSKCVARDALRA